MHNATVGNESQFTPSYSWGNGFWSFNIDTQAESTLFDKNPTKLATRTVRQIDYNRQGQPDITDTTVSQFSSYGSKFVKSQSTLTAKPLYDAYAYTPAGTDGYLITLDSKIDDKRINADVNNITMAGTQNTNKNVLSPLRNLTNAAAGIAGIAAITPFSNAILSQLGLLEPTYATSPLSQLNNKVFGLSVPLPDFRTKKTSLRGQSFNQLASSLLTRRLDGLSASTRANNGTPLFYLGLASTVGPYNAFNLNATYGWGTHDSITANRSDFTLRSNVASSWDFQQLKNRERLKNMESGEGAKIKHVLTQTKNILERVTPFRGDRVTVIDFSQRVWNDIYRWLPRSVNAAPGKQKLFEEVTEAVGANPYGTTKDFIKFFFTGPKLHKGSQNTPDDVIVFRAILTGFSDTFSPSWSPINMIGRADQNYHYGGYGRSIDVSFTVYATDRDELKYIYRKINALAGYTAPEYTADSFALKGPWLRITLGDYFISQPVIIDSLSYTFVDSDTTWEINIEDDPYIKQVTHKIDVSLGLTMITDYLPQKGGSFYTFTDSVDSNGKPNQTDAYGWLNDSKTSLGQPKIT